LLTGIASLEPLWRARLAVPAVPAPLRGEQPPRPAPEAMPGRVCTKPRAQRRTEKARGGKCVP